MGTVPTRAERPTFDAVTEKMGLPVDWRFTLKSTLREFSDDQLTDRAAALTYFAILSMFPALIAMVSMLSLVGSDGSAISSLIDQLTTQGILPKNSGIEGPLGVLLAQTPAPGLGLVIGLVAALWSASNYVKGFGRAMNAIYEVPEGRSPIRLNLGMFALTAGLLVLAALALLLIAISGPLVETVGALLHVGDGAMAAWNLLKLPALAVVVVLMVALLYHFTPNVRPAKLRLLSVGALTAIAIAGLASIGFGFYVQLIAASSYAKTYGALAGVILFLFWIWIMNVALLFGGELDAELERTRQLRAGVVAESRILLPPRDLAGATKAQRQADAFQRQRREIRFATGRGDGVTWTADEYVPGETASERVARTRPMEANSRPTGRRPGLRTRVSGWFGGPRRRRTDDPGPA